MYDGYDVDVIYWNEGKKGGKKKRYICGDWNGEHWGRCYRSNYGTARCKGWEKKNICIHPLSKEIVPDEWEYYDYVQIP